MKVPAKKFSQRRGPTAEEDGEKRTSGGAPLLGAAWESNLGKGPRNATMALFTGTDAGLFPKQTTIKRELSVNRCPDRSNAFGQTLKNKFFFPRFRVWLLSRCAPRVRRIKLPSPGEGGASVPPNDVCQASTRTGGQ